MNSAPVPGPSLWTAMLPPCNSTRDFTRAGPSPGPPAPFSPRPGPCQNGSNTRGSSSGAIPRPLSRTRRTACPASARAVSPMSPPGSVNLAALASRLISTCSSRTGSATRDTGPAGSATVSRCPRAASRCAVASVAPATTAASSTSSLQSGRLSREPAQRSKRSSTIRTARRAWWAAIVRVRRAAGSPSPECSSRAIRMAASGARNSWARVASPSSVGSGTGAGIVASPRSPETSRSNGWGWDTAAGLPARVRSSSPPRPYSLAWRRCTGPRYNRLMPPLLCRGGCMHEEHTTVIVQRYLDELGGAGQAESAVRALLDRAVRRLHELCAALLHRSYPRLTRPPLNLQADELLGAVVERLLKALREVRPGTVRQLFALASQHMRWELNEMARRLDEQPAVVELHDGLVPAPASSDSGLTPGSRRMLAVIANLQEREAHHVPQAPLLTLPAPCQTREPATRGRILGRMLTTDPHPLLDLAAFVPTFPRPLGEM